MSQPRKLMIAALLLTGCAQQHPAASGATAAEPTALQDAQSVLASSSPANGSTVAGPLGELELHFSRPVRLVELTLSAPDGSIMPTMVTSAGEQQHYKVPVSADQPGRYGVAWRVSANGDSVRGSFAFTIR